MAEEEMSLSEASGAFRQVLFISAGASHSVALLCKLHFFPFIFLLYAGKLLIYPKFPRYFIFWKKLLGSFKSYKIFTLFYLFSSTCFFIVLICSSIWCFFFLCFFLQSVLSFVVILQCYLLHGGYDWLTACSSLRYDLYIVQTTNQFMSFYYLVGLIYLYLLTSEPIWDMFWYDLHC